MEELILPPLPALPLCTVMIVNYNYARYLPDAIESALAQTYQNFEVVICDDGSKDNSRDVISRYAALDSRIRTIFKENAAVAAALNDTFRASKGEIITMLDADDLFAPSKLERVVERFLRGGRVGMIMNALTKIDSNGSVIGKIPQFGVFDRGEMRDAILRSGGYFSAAPTSGISLRRECAERVFPIPEKEFRTEADGYMRSIAALYYAVDVLDEPLTIYRVHSSNVTAAQEVDIGWAERVVSASQRVHTAIGVRATGAGWQIAPLENSVAYCEAVAVRDYLGGKPPSSRLANVRHLFTAARRVETADGTKARLKAAAVIAATLLPRFLGTRMIDAVYLPNAAKRILSRRKLARNETDNRDSAAT